MSIDFIFLLVFTITQSLGYTIFPDLFSSLSIVSCYFFIGILLGLISFTVLFVKNKIFHPQTVEGFYVPLSFSLAMNCMINIYIMSREFHLPLQMPITYGILFGILLWTFMKATHYFKKRVMISLVSSCVSLEIFWSILRGFTKDGILSVIVNNSNPAYTSLAALFIALAAFMLLYFGVPNLFLKIKSPIFKLFFMVIIICLFSQDISNSTVDRERTLPITKPNIILMVMDTTRVDHLSCYGYQKNTTPHIDTYAQRALVYKKAYATASWTLPSVASVLTGTYPGYHGAHRVTTSKNYYPMNKLDDAKTTLAEILKHAGYTTAGMVSCEFLTSSFGFHQGFDYFDERIPSYLFALSTFEVIRFLNYFFPVVDYLSSEGCYGYRVAAQINKSALSWLSKNGSTKPFFLFLHYFDPHHPYLPETLGTAKGNAPDTIREKYRKKNANYVDMERGIIDSVLSGTKPLLDDERNYLVHNYDREITLVDAKISEIFKKLKEIGIYDSSLIIITADHGESFGEHDLMLHGMTLYEDNIHVPLIIKYPLHDTQQGIIEYPVSLSGIVPTILSYVSIEIPEDIQGSPFIQRDQQKIIAQNFHDPHSKRFTSDLISLQVGDYKYIEASEGEDQLFNLGEDPLETTNLINQNSALKVNFQNLLDFHIKTLKLIEKSESVITIDQKTLQNLKALGYIN